MKRFLIGALAVLALAASTPLFVHNEYYFFAGYVVLQFIVLATAWNILGGYAGYVNFGTGASSRSAPIPQWRCTRPTRCRSRCRSWPAPRCPGCSASASAC
jgi:membrane protein YqaA with SNARE-associated domain